MKTRPKDRTGVLIVRLWIEEGADEGLRARITKTLDSSDSQQQMATAAYADDIYDIVRVWVEAFVNSN